MSVEHTSAPVQVRVGEPFVVTATLRGDGPARGVVKLYRNGDLATHHEVVLPQQDLHVVRFPQRLETGGFHQYTVVIANPDDAISSNNEGGAIVYAYGKPKVLYVAESPVYDGRGETLTKHGFQVAHIAPTVLSTSVAPLLAYDVIIFDNLPARTVTVQQMQAITDYVERHGGGFIMIGGDKSFGPGGYTHTPIEDILPVEMRVRRQEKRPRLALVVLLDTSGSMATEQIDRAKIEVAKAAVLSLIEVLDPGDAMGLIAFDREPKALIPLQQVADVSTLHDRMQTMQPRGGTAIYPALAMAYQWLQSAEMEKKHVLLVSDGRTAPADFPTLVDKLVASTSCCLSWGSAMTSSEPSYKASLPEVGEAHLVPR